MKRIGRPLLLIAFLCVPVGQAVSEDGRRWLGETFDEGASLIYGTPESDDVPIGFVCDRVKHQLRLTLMLGSDVPPRKGLVKAELAAQPMSERWSVSGEFAVLEGFDATIFEGTGKFDVPLARMLKQGKLLAVTIGRQSFQFPLAGAAEAMKPIEGACATPG